LHFSVTDVTSPRAKSEQAQPVGVSSVSFKKPKVGKPKISTRTPVKFRVIREFLSSSPTHHVHNVTSLASFNPFIPPSSSILVAGFEVANDGSPRAAPNI
jgi:hypothetical protein